MDFLDRCGFGPSMPSARVLLMALGVSVAEVIFERRAHPRATVGVRIACSSFRKESSAVLRDLSLSGALLESVSFRPPLGTTVTLRFETLESGRDEAEEVRAEVVRHTSDGYAVRFPAPASIISSLVERYGAES